MIAAGVRALPKATLLFPTLFIAGLVVGGCGDDAADSGVGLTTTSGPGGSTSSDPGSTTTATSTATSTSSNGSATTVSVEDLLARPDDPVGSEVEIVGRAFFLASCPPPLPGSEATCVLTLYLADVDRNDLLFGERDQAIPLTEDGRRVSCVEDASTPGGCPGWDHAAPYRITGTVQFEEVDGRSTGQLVVDVVNKQPQ